MIDAEATEGVEYFPVKWLADQRRAISNRYKLLNPAYPSDEYQGHDLALIYADLYTCEAEMRDRYDLPPIGALPEWARLELKFV